MSALFYLVYSCTAGSKSDGDDTSATTTAESGDSGLPPGPCADGGYGGVSDPRGAIHVRVGGDDGDAGTPDAPVATAAAALALARSAGVDQTILFGPGTFAMAWELEGDDGMGHSDNGLSVVGCGLEETTLTPEVSDESTLAASEVVGLSVSDLGFSGGRPALWLWNGTGASLADLRVIGSGRVGILVDGSDTIVDLADVAIEDTVAETTDEGVDAGYGVQVHLATFTATRLTVSGSTTAGVLVDAGIAAFEELTVEDTATDGAGAWGRGLQVQSLSSLELTGGAFAGNHDAAVYVTASTPVGIRSISVTSTDAASIPDSTEQSGDGIVVTQGPDGVYDPALFAVDLSDNSVTGAARVGILVEGVSAVLDGNVAGSGNGVVVSGNSIFAQGDAVTSGSDTVTTLTTGGTLEPIELNYDMITAEAP